MRDNERGKTEYLIFQRNGNFDHHIMSRPYHLAPDEPGGLEQLGDIFNALGQMRKVAGEGKQFCIGIKTANGTLYLNRRGEHVSRDTAYQSP